MVPVLFSVLASGVMPVRAQVALLKGLTSVRVLVSWTGGADSNADALRTDVELKLRQAGLRVLSSEEQTATPGHPLFFVGLVGTGVVIPVTIGVVERASLERDNIAFTAWLEAREKQPSPITDAEIAAQTHWSDVTTWMRYGAAQNAQAESVQEIIARYKREWAGVGMSRVAEHMMDLEVQAATARLQNPTNPGTVRDTVKSYVDIFLNDWLAANPRQH